MQRPCYLNAPRLEAFVVEKIDEIGNSFFEKRLDGYSWAVGLESVDP